MPGAPKQTLFVSGGCRSGKSAFAEQWVAACGAPRLYIATAAVLDTEMAQRVRLHKQRRGPGWRTVEEPLDVEGVLRGQAGGHAAVLLDCLTLWVANLQYRGDSPEHIAAAVRGLACAVREAPCSVAVVTNEVGWGIVPESSVGRAFRDLAGMCNQILAAHMENAVLLVSGLPLVLKGTACPPGQRHTEES